MSHENELLTLIEEYGDSRYKAGLTLSKIAHHVNTIAVMKDLTPQKTPSAPPRTRVSMSVAILQALHELGGEADAEGLRRLLASKGYDVKKIGSAIQHLKKQGRLSIVAYGIYQLPSSNGTQEGGSV